VLGVLVRGVIRKKPLLRDEYSGLNDRLPVRFGIVSSFDLPGADDRLILLIWGPIPAPYGPSNHELGDRSADLCYGFDPPAGIRCFLFFNESFHYRLLFVSMDAILPDDDPFDRLALR
jgi:hypothetical protein